MKRQNSFYVVDVKCLLELQLLLNCPEWGLQQGVNLSIPRQQELVIRRRRLLAVCLSKIPDSSTSVIGKLLLLVLGSVERWLGADEMHFFRVMVVKWIVMHSCRQCSRQVNSITPQHHNTTSLNTCCKYLMRTLKILQHLIIYLAFEIHIFMAPTGDHTTYTTNPFWCPTMQWQEGKWRENKNTGIMMNYVANHHVSDGWLIDSGKQLDAPVGMAGLCCLCLVHLSYHNECWVTIRRNTQHTPPLLSLWCSTVNNVDTAWLAAAAAPYFQHEQGEGEWRWYLFQMKPAEAAQERWRGLLVMCCDVMYSSLSLDLQFCVKSLQ